MESRNAKMAVCDIKVVILNYFENFVLNPTINIKYNHIHKIFLKVFRGISYRRNTVEITLFQKYEVTYSENKTLFKEFVLKKSNVGIIHS